MFYDTEAQTYKGMTARIIQHEIDHLNGIDYQKRANRIHLERARNQFKRRQRQRAWFNAKNILLWKISEGVEEEEDDLLLY